MSNNVDVDKLLARFNNDGEKKKPAIEWDIEESKSVKTVAGRDPVKIEITHKPDSDGLRNVRISRGRNRVNFDIQSAHLVAIVIESMSRKHVPEAMRRESVLKEFSIDSIVEDV